MTSLQIHDLAPLGDGVHHAGHERIYVDRTLPGDIVEAKVRKSEGGIVRADLLRIVEPSIHRAEAPCPHYANCGGCTLQHASGNFYRDWKIEHVRTALRRQHLEPIRWLDPVFLPIGARRRATFAAERKNGKLTIGYHRRRSHAVAEIPSCLTVDPGIMGLRENLVSVLAPLLQEGKPVAVFIQTVAGRFEVVITGPVGKKGYPDFAVHEGLADAAAALELSRVAWRAWEHGEPEVIVEREPLLAHFGALEVALPPLAFLQPTVAGEAALVSAVMEAVPAQGRFADLFSGCGTFTGPLSSQGPVDAFEVTSPAVRALAQSKVSNPLRVEQRDLFRNPLTARETKHYHTIIFDPPRAGAQVQVQALAEGNVPRLIGVSCNPVTFARDARLLVSGGYALETVRVIDQFT